MSSIRVMRMSAILPAVAFAVALASGTAAGAEPRHDPFARYEPLSEAELDELRGGFFTVAGWQIAFGIEVEVDLDGRLFLRSWLNPEGTGGFNLDVGGKSIARADDGQVQTQGSLGSEQTGSITRYDFGDFTASLDEQDDGFALHTDGEYPVSLAKGGHGLSQQVGSPTTTLAEVHALLSQVSSMLTNVQDGVTVSQFTTFNVDVLNHNEMAGVNSSLNAFNQRLVNFVGRDLISFR